MFGALFAPGGAEVVIRRFEDYGLGFGWRRVFAEQEMQERANAGEVCIIVAKRTNVARSGHINAVILLTCFADPFVDLWISND